MLQEIHTAYLEAGADILETNSFSGTVIAQVCSPPQASADPFTRAAAACFHRGRRHVTDLLRCGRCT